MWTRSLLRASSSSNRRGQRNGGLLRIFCGKSRRTICLLLGTDNGKLLWCQFASKCHRYHRAIFPADVFFAPVVAWVVDSMERFWGMLFHDGPLPVIVFCCVSEGLLFFRIFKPNLSSNHWPMPQGWLTDASGGILVWEHPAWQLKN